ncbi:MAG: radical SAM protein [Vulcanimicrobiota bacterium]
MQAIPVHFIDPSHIFHPEHGGVFELSPEALELYQKAIDGEVAEGPAMQELLAADLLRAGEAPAFPPPPKDLTLRSLVVNLTQNCNLACVYCYADVLPTAKKKRQMEPETARAAIDFLLRQSGSVRTLNLTFFGGEPLLNFPLLKQSVLYAEDEARKAGKKLRYSLTTNATLVTEEMARFLDEYRIGVSISLDGPPEVQDGQRPFVNGRGSSNRVLKGVETLLTHVRSRPVGARVTLTRQSGSVVPIFDYLHELGFFEVGLAPVTDPRAELHLGDEEMERLLDDFRILSERTVQEARAGRYLGFSNLTNMLSSIHAGRKRVYPCGAGLGLFGVDYTGKISLCHRFQGNEDFVLGDVWQGLDAEAVHRLRREVHPVNKLGCHTCWIRTLCRGGCYHEALERHGDHRKPNLHTCDWLRAWVKLVLEVYLTLAREAPGFLDRLSGSRARMTEGVVV